MNTKQYNTVWITDKNPDVVDPTFLRLPDKELHYMIDTLHREHGAGPLKMTKIGRYTMVEYGDPNKAVFFCEF